MATFRADDNNKQSVDHKQEERDSTKKEVIVPDVEKRKTVENYSLVQTRKIVAQVENPKAEL